MIKHIVCFKLKDNSQENMDKTKDVLMSMVGNVPQIREIEVGTDFLNSERSYDVILQVTLDNLSELKNYQSDTYHCSKVKTYMHKVMESSISVDYQV